MLEHREVAYRIRRLIRGVVFGAVCCLFIGALALWYRSRSNTDSVAWFIQRTTGAVSRQQWQLETYQGGVLLDVNNVVYEVSDGDQDVPDKSGFVLNASATPQSAADVRANGLGFVVSTYADAVRSAPAVTQMGQRLGLPMWLLSSCFGAWPIAQLILIFKRRARRSGRGFPVVDAPGPSGRAYHPTLKPLPAQA